MRTVAAFVIVMVVLALQLMLVRMIPAVPDVALAALLALAGSVGFLMQLALVTLSVLVLNWQPGPHLDLVLFAALPLIGWFVAHRLPFQSWLAGFIVAAAGSAVFPLVLAPSVVFNEPFRYARLWGIALIIALLVTWILDMMGKRQGKV